MKYMQNISIAALLVMLMTLTGCEFIEGIFNLGVAVGIFLVIVVVGLIIWIFSRIG